MIEVFTWNTDKIATKKRRKTFFLLFGLSLYSVGATLDVWKWLLVAQRLRVVEKPRKDTQNWFNKSFVATTLVDHSPKWHPVTCSWIASIYIHVRCYISTCRLQVVGRWPNAQHINFQSHSLHFIAVVSVWRDVTDSFGRLLFAALRCVRTICVSHIDRIDIFY